MFNLPVEQSPEITPHGFVSANYPGANAETVAESLATPVEQEPSGIENLFTTSRKARTVARHHADLETDPI